MYHTIPPFNGILLLLATGCGTIGLDYTTLADDSGDPGLEIGSGGSAGSGGGNNGGGSGGGGGNTEETVTLSDGSWTFVEFELGNTNCSSLAGLVPFEEAVGAEIALSGSSLFELHYDGLDELETCTLGGTLFDCSGTVWETHYEEFDISLTYDMRSIGEFHSDTQAMGELGLNVECEGESCESLAETAGVSLPCDFRFDWEMEQDL
jgi:hypothetical protein